jgi:hypothetical protein
MDWPTWPNWHIKTLVHPPLAGSIGYAALPEARLGSTYVEILTDPPQLTYVNFVSTQGEIPVDRQLAAQPLEGPQNSTVLTLSKISHKEQQSLCEQLQLIRDQLAQTSLILDRMDQCDEVHDERLKLFKHTGKSVVIQRDMEQPAVIPTTDRDQPSFINDLYSEGQNCCNVLNFCINLLITQQEILRSLWNFQTR